MPTDICHEFTDLIFYFQTLIQIKERKDMDEAFKKAQKPWAKLLQKVNKAKQDYHAACKAEKSAANQERNASGDTSISPDQVSTQSEECFRSQLERKRL